MFREGDTGFTSPIPDSDAEGPVRLTGLDLPEKVLRLVYWENPRALLKLHE